MPTLRLSSSDLNKRITIQREALDVKGNGSEEETWVEVVANVPAKVVQTTARKIQSAGQEQIQYDHVVTIRWIESFEFTGVKHRVIYKGRPLEIVKEPAEIGIKQFLELTCLTIPTR